MALSQSMGNLRKPADIKDEFSKDPSRRKIVVDADWLDNPDHPRNDPRNFDPKDPNKMSLLKY